MICKAAVFGGGVLVCFTVCCEVFLICLPSMNVMEVEKNIRHLLCHSGSVVSTAARPVRAFLGGVWMLSLCLCGFPLTVKRHVDLVNWTL